jgi:hypothetical protein
MDVKGIRKEYMISYTEKYKVYMGYLLHNNHKKQA